MELTKEHREILIDKLLSIRDNISDNESLMDSAETQPDLLPLLEMDNYMLRIQKDTIVEALINNDIDF